MASTYSPLKVELIGTGEQVATWGQTTNTNLGTAIEQAIGGKADVTMSSTSVTLTLTDTNALQDARALYLNLTGTPGGAAVLEVPAVQKAYIVKNGTTGGFAVTVKVAGQTGVSVPNGATMHLYNNGTDVVNAMTNLPSGATVGGVAIGTGSGSVTSVTGTGTVNGITLTGSVTTTGSLTLGGTLANVDLTSQVTGTLPTNRGGTGQTVTQYCNLASNVTGTLPAANGGTGVTTPGTNGNVLTSNGTAWTSTAPTNSFSTLLVGTQTNKATISYTTDAARTLTVPAVAGNRTFAFIDEAQTYTANQTVQADLTFDGNGRKIKGNFTPYSSNATLFQTTVSAQGTSLGVIPNGGNNDTALIMYAGTDPANTNFVSFYCSDIGTYIASGSVGTGTTQDFAIITNGSSRIDVAASGEVAVNTAPDANTSLIVAANGRTYSLKADARVQFSGSYGYTVGATNRTLYIDSGGDIGGLSSTRESKKNIVPIEDASWLMSLEPVSYNRRKRDGNGAYTEEANENTEFGLIADDVATIRPELCIFVDGKVSGISYEQLIAPMIKEIQNLRAEVNALKEKLSG